MKLIVTSDDFGITYGITDGIIHGIRNGVITQTGLFTNMECSEYAGKKLIKEFPNFCLGIDFNLVAGKPISKPEDIQSLVQKNGYFLTSGMHREIDKTDDNHIEYDHAFLEMENQLEKFIEIIGKSPAYLQGHSYGTPITRRAMKDISKKYCIPLLSDILKMHNLPSGAECAPWNIKPFSFDDQALADPLEYFVNGKLEYLNEALNRNEVSHIHVHAGFVDSDIFKVSSYTLIRMKELGLLCSTEFKDWIDKNNIKLIDFREL